MRLLGLLTALVMSISVSAAPNDSQVAEGKVARRAERPNKKRTLCTKSKRREK